MTALADEVRSALADAADPERAPGMAAYMKSEMPFLGVGRPVVRRIARAASRDHPQGLDERVAVVGDMWEEAAFREEPYAAQDLLGVAPARGRVELLALHEHIARTGAWWDHVDEQAHRISETLAGHTTEVATAMRRWSIDDSLWVRRLAIIGQLGAKTAVDRRLLTDVVEPNLDHPDFFVRKAIGWALREVARHDPAWVREFVETRPLSPLSRREALKHL